MLRNPNSVYDISDAEFEDVVARIFEDNGFSVKVTKRTRDGGKDIIATYDMKGIPCILYIECKHFSPNHPVGVSIVRGVYGTQMSDRISKSIIVSTSRFTRDAHAFIEDKKALIDLITLDELIEFVRQDTVEQWLKTYLEDYTANLKPLTKKSYTAQISICKHRR